MDFLLAPASWYYSDGVGPAIVGGTMMFIFVTAFLCRLGNMFRKYVKTGTLNCDGREFMDNLGEAVGDWRKIPKLFRDFYLNTDPDEMFYDFIMFFFVSLAALMVAGLLPYIFVVWLLIYSVISLAKYLRRRVEMKEEFIARLKGDR